MLEFLIELKAMLLGVRSGGQLPDCRSILFIIKSSPGLDPRSAARFVALCRLTGVAIVVRWTSIGLIGWTGVLLYRQASMQYVAVSAVLWGGATIIFGMLARLAAYLAGECYMKATSSQLVD
jgi:hypothetical protein